MEKARYPHGIVMDGYRFVEFRADGDTLSGTVLRYGDTARIGGFSERFEPGSLRFADDVIVNLMHDRNKPVARTGAGLTVSSDNERIEARIELPDTTFGREARELVQARILRGFSLEFRAEKERWEGRSRIVMRATAAAFGIVDRPAYPESRIEARLAELHESPVARVWY